MWDSRLSHRIATVVILLLALITVSTCQSTQYPPLAPCVPANDPKKPLVCVDSAGEPNPKKQEAYDRTSKWPWGRQVKVTWRADPAAVLDVDFADESCVEAKDVTCTGPECTAKIKKMTWDPSIPDDQEHRDCTYKTTITIGGRTIDPDGDLIVNPCCM